MKKYEIGYYLVERVIYSDRWGSWSEFKTVDYLVYKTLEEATQKAIELNNASIMIKECKIDAEGKVIPRGNLHTVKYGKAKKEEPIISEKPEWKIVE